MTDPLTSDQVAPRRVQLQRTKGWRMPPNTVKVDRSSRLGNPFTVGLVACGCRAVGECTHNMMRCETAAEAVQAYREIPRSETRLAYLRDTLRGKNLACWCPLDQPCHADVLLEIANG
jgi:uncharacterized protein DUF4326